ncbi:MAG: mechanosensitive ion channel [Scytolyngbya sp. HA4215-MV1]|jgi:small-conductance mechanosensitive channel|nr:mechanosensitive ion channel [Scytolyngbya sp. HA4215-MV1]
MNWLTPPIQQVLNPLSRIFSATLFESGGNRFSLGLILGLIFATIAVFVVSRVFSEWLKRRLLARMGLDRGNREVVATFTRYVLTVLGFTILLQTAGVNLSSLAVLAGALGIGLGFGLQNFASNFVSGITLLLEQPMRVGDFIEVDNLLGTVESISIRSTTVRTQDGVFVIVPNIRLVENNIINWSHRDPRCRLHLPVSISYGTDPFTVTEALLAAARAEPKVLSTPSPKVWLRGFGDSDLSFELLVWIDQPQESDPIKSSLNFLIEREITHRGLEIPHPQRDLYIRNLDEVTGLFHPHPTSADIKNPPSPLETPVELSSASTKSSISNLGLRDLLRRITYFEQCTDIDLLQLIEYGYRQLFPAGQVICQEGEPGNSFYIILSGSVEIFSRKTEQYIATLNEGEFFGEMSLLLGIPRSATVRSLEETVLFVVDHKDLQRLLKNHQELADQIAQKLLERQQTLQEIKVFTGPSEETPLFRIRKHLQTLFGI